MSETESSTAILQRLLDERGVKWWEGDDERKTLWESNGLTWEYFNDDNGDAWLGFLGACEQDITPEQAIAATLGSEREKALEELVKQLWYLVNHRSGYGYAAALEAIEELGIEVDE